MSIRLLITTGILALVLTGCGSSNLVPLPGDTSDKPEQHGAMVPNGPVATEMGPNTNAPGYGMIPPGMEQRPAQRDQSQSSLVARK